MSNNSEQLKIFVLGFATDELRLMEAAVALSARRKPALALVSREHCADAAVWLIDGNAPVDDKKWAVRLLRTLPDKVVIWVDAAKIPSTHTSLNRPIAWVNLPLILGKAMREQSEAAQRRAADASDSVQDGSSSDLGGGQWLVVEDSAPARLHLRQLLEARGVRVHEAESAEAALAQLAAGARYEGVFMDVVLPGVDGYEACRRVRAQAPALPVIMLTSRTSPFDRMRGSMAGCSAYLTKPTEAQDLYATMERCLAAAKSA